jgi:hypothetical protein
MAIQFMACFAFTAIIFFLALVDPFGRPPMFLGGIAMEHGNVSQTSTLSSTTRGSMVVVVSSGVGGLAWDSGFVHFQHCSLFSDDSTLLSGD